MNEYIFKFRTNTNKIRRLTFRASTLMEAEDRAHTEADQNDWAVISVTKNY
jgi:hypothetical protein